MRLNKKQNNNNDKLETAVQYTHNTVYRHLLSEVQQLYF